MIERGEVCDLAFNSGLSIKLDLKRTRLFSVLFCIVILLPTCLYGAVDPILSQVTAAVMFLLMLGIVVIVPPPKHLEKLIKVALLVVALILAYVVLQAVRVPARLAWHAVWSLPIQQDGQVSGAVSISPTRTLVSIIPLAHTLFAFIACLWLCRDERQIIRFLKAFTIFAGGIAFLSLLQFEIAPAWLIAVEKVTYLDSLTAPFVNRNTAATFYAMTVSIAITTAVASYTAPIDGVGVHGAARPRGQSLRSFVFYGVVILVALIALVLTKSRAGLLSAIVAFGVHLPLLLLFPPAGSNARRGFGRVHNTVRLHRVWLALASLLGVALVFLIVGQRQLQRLDVEGISDNRFCILPRVISLVVDNMAFGTGLGTFEQSYSSYRDPVCGIYGRWLSAHNFYLDTLVTLGIVGGLILTMGFISAFLILVRGIIKRRRYRALPIGGIAILSLAATHSLFDFSMEVSGFSVPFVALLAVCLAACFQSHDGTVPDRASDSLNVAAPRSVKRRLAEMGKEDCRGHRGNAPSQPPEGFGLKLD